MLAQTILQIYILMNFVLFIYFSPARTLSAIQDREICCYSISCKEKDNIGKQQLQS